jgi:hypothetical protein
MVFDAINYRNVDAENVRQTHWVVRFFLLVFLFVCVFDPADQILGGKVFIFGALWGLTAINIVSTRDNLYLPPGLVIYVGMFVAIPLLSILWYFVINGKQPFEGFVLLKGYLLISFAIVLFLNRLDLIPQLSAVLTILSCSVIAVFVALELEPDLFGTLYPIGVDTGLLILDHRSYGDFELIQVYFVTSPMIVISIAHYFDRAMVEPGVARKLVFLLLTAINIAGMFLAGSRNNIFVSLLLPFLLWPLYTKRIVLSALVSFGVLSVLALPFADQLQAFLDPSEVSNGVKLAMLDDYARIFGNPVTLLFGQGLGAYETWSAVSYFYITELTYLEMVRNFGLIGALVMLALLLFPIANAFFTQVSPRERALAVAYFLYLVMCISNPNLFSSMGILILAILLANIFQARERELRAVKREFS